MRLGIFGGTFNPVHTGHIQAAKICRTALALDRVLLMPAKNPGYKRCGIEYAHRLAMCRLAVAYEPDLEVSSLEGDLPGTAYTRDVLREARGLYPGARIFLIMGREVFNRLPGWKGAEEIMGAASIVVMERAGAGTAVQVHETTQEGILSVTANFAQISSTMIRDRSSRGISVAEWIEPEVMRYILNERLYQIEASNFN